MDSRPYSNVGAILVVPGVSAAQRGRETAFEGRMPSVLGKRLDPIGLYREG